MTIDDDGRISLKDHYDALRAQDQRFADALREADGNLREAVRIGDLALQAERERSAEMLEATKETALAAALLTVKEKAEVSVLGLAKAADVLAHQTVADKAAANEWRGTVNDIISKMGGMKIMWGIIAGLIAIGFMIWNNVEKTAERVQSTPVQPVPVTVTQPANTPVPVKDAP